MSSVFKRDCPKRFTELINAVFGHRWNSFSHTFRISAVYQRTSGLFKCGLWGTEESFFEERTLWPFYPIVFHCQIGSEVSCCQSQSWSIDLIKQIWLLKLELSERWRTSKNNISSIDIFNVWQRSNPRGCRANGEILSVARIEVFF